MATSLDSKHELGRVQRELNSLKNANLEGGILPGVQRIENEMKDSSQGSEQVEQLCVDFKQLRDEIDTYAKLFKKLKESRELLENTSQKQAAETTELQYSVSKQKSLFEHAMGMRFNITDDQAVTVEFQHLYHTHPENSCHITLDVDNQGHWIVLETSPELQITTLLQQLNTTKDLTQFCKNVRHKFKQLVH